MKMFVNTEYKSSIYKSGLYFAGIMLFLILALLLTGNTQWNLSIPSIVLFSLFFCFGIFRSLKLGICIDGEDIFKKGIFIKKEN